MVEEQRTRVEEAMTNMVNEVDKLHLRKMQVIFLSVLSLKKDLLSSFILHFDGFIQIKPLSNRFEIFKTCLIFSRQICIAVQQNVVITMISR
jgi:hypothetical protein